jgi:hypothetical protein
MGEHPDMTAKTLHPLSPATLFAASFLVFSGAACAVDAAAAPASAPSSVALQAKVQQLIGDAGCDNSHQCRSLGIGAKPCGGPESYLAWSVKVTDAHALQEAVAALAQARVDENKRSGMASDCMMRPEPTAVCRPRGNDGKPTCQLGQGGVESAV